MSRRIVLSCAAFVVATGAIAWGVREDARLSRLAELLRAVDAAEDAGSYSGVRRMSFGAESVRLRVWSKDAQKRLEPIGGMPGPRSRMPMLDGLSFFLKPEPGLGRRTERDRQLTLRNYDLVSTGHDTVAGRAAETWELRPRHAGRGTYRTAVDAERRLLLSIEALRGDAPLFSMRFEDIAFDVPFPERGASSGGRRRPEWLKVEREAAAPTQLSERAGFPVWIPAWIPPGFELRESELIRIRPNISAEMKEAVKRMSPFPVPNFDSAVVKVSYTDGLAFLAFIEVAASSELWQFVKKLIPAGAPEAPVGKVLARKFPDRGGAAYLLELGESVVFVAGNAGPDEMESMIRTFERR